MGSLVESFSYSVKSFGQETFGGLLGLKGPFFKESDYPDLTGQTWVVTGATGGIGLEIAKILVGQNATVWIVGRNEEKITKALETLRKLNRAGKVEAATIDYNDLASVKPGAEKIITSTGELNGIIHNAGVMNVPKGTKTKQGYEPQLGVNNLATQLLQDLLDPLIENTPEGRIVWLSSAGHAIAPRDGFDFEGMDKSSSWTLYGQSKALNIIQAAQWTRKHPNANVKALSAHPGVIKSDLARTTGGLLGGMVNVMQCDTYYGAYSPIYAALSPKAQNNEYSVPWGRAGKVRPDVERAAHGERGAEADMWIEKQIAAFK